MTRWAAALVLAVISGALLISASPASATTWCADGTLAPSPGGPETCSSNRGIASNDYAYSPDGPTLGFEGESEGGFRWTTSWIITVITVGLLAAAGIGELLKPGPRPRSNG